MTAVDAINAWLHRQHVRTGTSTASFMSARAATLERSAAVALGIAVVCWKIEIDLYFLLMYGVAAAICFFLFRAPRARRAGCCCACAVAAAALPLLLLGGPLAIAAVTDLQRDPPSALHAAAAANDAVRVAELAAVAVSPPANSTWAWASETPLGAAAQRGHSAAVAALLDAGAGADRGVELGPLGALWAQSPLHALAYHASAQRGVAALLARGADPALGVSFGPLGLLWVQSPLHRAAQLGHASVVDALLDGGAEPGRGVALGPRGCLGTRSPLHAAASFPAATAVRALLRRGADPSRGAALGPLGMLWAQSPLHRAAQLGHADVVDALLAGGADPGRGLFNGPLGVQSPRDAALDAGYKAIAAKIEKAARGG